MDVIDYVTHTEEHILKMRTDNIRAQAKTQNRKQPPRGTCHYCDEKFPQGDSRLFCDADCREDFVKYSKK